jgi:NtrC-family two-component system sensor histidine kinase KinB
VTLDRAAPLEGPRLWKAGLFVGSLVLAIAVFLFTHQMIQRLTREVETTSRVLARFCAQASLPATRDTTLQRIFGEVLSGIDFPIVITDTAGIPRAWRDVEPNPALVSAAALDSLQMGQPVAPVTLERIQRVKARVVEMDRRNRPIEMMAPGTGVRLGAVHYGQPPVLERLQLMPFLSVGGLLLLLGLGLWGLTSIRQAEKRTLWVGLAKETAHQLGTPLSSLMGWVELLRSRAEASPTSEDITIPATELNETIEEMDRDLDRLSKVAQRFSHIGSTPILVLQDITPVVREAVQYMRKRLPQGGARVELRERYEEVPPTNVNRELLEWVLENVLSNAISSLERKAGTVEVVVRRRAETEAVEVTVRDTGRGMTLAEQRRAFDPGYSTRSRGWGLGLALARRVVQDYHGGRIYIRDSAPGQGTSVVIVFPT